MIKNVRFKPGDVFFVMHHDSNISKAIAWAMSSKWSHCGLVFDASQMNDYTLETNSYCVTHGTMLDYLVDGNVSMEVYRPESDSEMMQFGLWNARHNLFGAVYGYLQLLSLGLRRLCMKFNLRIKNYIRQSVVCCHVVGYAYRDARVIGFIETDPESFDTEELHQKVSKSVHFTKIFEK